MKRARLITLLTQAVATATNQTWREDAHVIRAIRRSIDTSLPKGDVVAVMTNAQANALYYAAGYCLEFAGEGDHADIKGARAKTFVRARRALEG